MYVGSPCVKRGGEGGSSRSHEICNKVKCSRKKYTREWILPPLLEANEVIIDGRPFVVSFVSAEIVKYPPVSVFGFQDAQGGGFKAVAGKYELIETDSSDTTAAASMVASGGCGGCGAGASSSSPPARILPCTLKPATKELVELVFRYS